MQYSLFIFSLLLSPIFGIEKQESKKCTVFPINDQRCFSPTKAENSNGKNVVSETYTSNQEHYSFTVNKKVQGDKIVIGEPPNPAKRSRNVKTCTMNIDGSLYEEKFGTKLRNSKDGRSEESKFIVTRRQLWTCEGTGRNSRKFYRIVTELLSKDVIGTVEYFAGTEVTRIPIPHKTPSDAKEYYTAAIREIKYVNMTTGEIVGFNGKLKFVDPTVKIAVTSHDFKLKYTTERVLKEKKDGDVEIVFPSNQHGPVLEKTPNPVIFESPQGNSQTERKVFTDEQRLTGFVAAYGANCEEADEKSDFYLTEYLPHWSFKTSVRKMKDGQEIWEDGEITDIPSTNFLDYFVVTINELWKCETISYVGDESILFYRRVIEYVAKTPVDVVEVYCGKTVFELKLAGAEKSMGIRQITYFNQTSPLENKQFNGKLNLRTSLIDKIGEELNVVKDAVLGSLPNWNA